MHNGGGYQTLGGGATLLYASGTTDISFMSLTPPTGRSGVRGMDHGGGTGHRN
jgi:hypothetical protein